MLVRKFTARGTLPPKDSGSCQQATGVWFGTSWLVWQPRRLCVFPSMLCCVLVADLAACPHTQEAVKDLP